MWNMEIKLLIVITGLLTCLVASTSAAMDKKIDRRVFKKGRIFNKYIESCEDTFYNCKTGRFSIPSIKAKVDKCMKYKSKKGCNTCRGTGNIVICPKICDCKECERHHTWSKEKIISPQTCRKPLFVKKPIMTMKGAKFSDIGDWPWHAGLAINVNDQWIITCGGALIARNWVITAAHCVTYRHTTKLMDTSQFKIYLGKHYRDDYKDDTRVQTFRVKAIITHPNFHPRSLDSDLALIQLSHAARFTPIVMPICLPDPSEVDIEDHLQEKSTGVASVVRSIKVGFHDRDSLGLFILVTGWGLEGENLNASTFLKYASLPIVSKRMCEDGYERAKSPLTITTNMYCAGFSHGQIGTCSGDSGGPMVFDTGYGRNRKYFLMGLLSWSGVNGCALPEQYSGFTLVYKFLDWINCYI